jgi:hypothetical protein
MGMTSFKTVEGALGKGGNDAGMDVKGMEGIIRDGKAFENGQAIVRRGGQHKLGGGCRSDNGPWSTQCTQIGFENGRQK